MAFTTAKSGREEALIEAARDHARALRAEPGCVAAYVLEERGTPDQVALSIFESEEAFRKAAEATRPVIARHRIGELLEGPPRFRYFESR